MDDVDGRRTQFTRGEGERQTQSYVRHGTCRYTQTDRGTDRQTDTSQHPHYHTDREKEGER